MGAWTSRPPPLRCGTLIVVDSGGSTRESRTAVPFKQAALTKKMKEYCLGHFLGVDEAECSYCLCLGVDALTASVSSSASSPSLPPPWVHQRGQIVPLLPGAVPSSSLAVGEVLGGRGPLSYSSRQAALSKKRRDDIGCNAGRRTDEYYSSSSSSPLRYPLVSQSGFSPA
ncbi:hypothetical protein C8R46DRAFT_1052581 [Mycena filopes]|nr:hypothetical protein C8R46DRAFT_1052581 [Mycena filopes]